MEGDGEGQGVSRLLVISMELMLQNTLFNDKIVKKVPFSNRPTRVRHCNVSARLAVKNDRGPPLLMV